MPFVTIEVNKELHFDLEPFARETHEYLQVELGGKLETYKTKVFRLTETYVGDGKKDNYYARLKIELLSGRERKKLIACGKELFKRFEELIRLKNPNVNCRITMEFREIDRELLFMQV